MSSVKHGLLFAYKFKLICIQINLQILQRDHAVIFVSYICVSVILLKGETIRLLGCVQHMPSFTCRLIAVRIFIIFRTFIVARSTKELRHPGWLFTWRCANNSFNSINLKVRCGPLLFKEYLEFVLWLLKSHHIVVFDACLLPMCCVPIPLGIWLVSSLARRCIGRFIQVYWAPYSLDCSCIYHYSFLFIRGSRLLPGQIHCTWLNLETFNST